jgi:predicted dehydrogenase
LIPWTGLSAAASPFGWEAATGENPDIARTGLPCYTVLATKGSITIPELTRFHYDSYPATEGHWLNDIESDTSLAKAIDDVPSFTLQLKHFVDVIKGAAQPSCSGLEGLKDIMVLEAVEKSMRSHVPVFHGRCLILRPGQLRN